LDTLNAAALQTEMRAVVLTGSERAFAVGAELTEVSSLDAPAALEFSRLGQEVMTCVERFPRPVIAAIRGFCLGGGLDLALACHLRIASPDARFAHPGGALGLMTGWGGTARLPVLIRRGRAIELLVTGRLIGAAEAYAFGLVNRLCAPESLVESAIALAGSLRENCRSML
jgi:enoyl-CoA hydratase